MEDSETINPQSAIRNPYYKDLWFTALAVFVLAGLTGAFIRIGLITGFPRGLQYANVRHAHSHLMYFGWVTPALMALIAAGLPAVTDGPASARFRKPIIMAIIGGLLAYLPFLFYGYAPATLGGGRIPLSVLTASFNVLSWYWFVWIYWQETRRVARNYPLQLWDGALVYLVFASLGAWGVAVVTRLEIQDPFWSLAMTHIFLDTFSYGWFILGVLGVAYVSRPQLAGNQMARCSINFVVIGMPVIFLLGMPLHVVPELARWIAALGALLVAIGLFGHIAVLWRVTIYRKLNTDSWNRWAVASGVRVLYLHWLLLGFVTLGLVTGALEKWGREAVAGWRWMAASILILILSLIPLTTVWPAAQRGDWVRYFAAVAALGPAIAAIIMIIQSPRTGKMEDT
jgi:hypothetical protein